MAVLRFGKHKGKKLDDLINLEPDYVLWLSEQLGSKWVGEPVRNWFGNNTTKVKDLANNLPLEISFGKFEGVSVYEVPCNYLNWILENNAVKNLNKRVREFLRLKVDEIYNKKDGEQFLESDE